MDWFLVVGIGAILLATAIVAYRHRSRSRHPDPPGHDEGLPGAAPPAITPGFRKIHQTNDPERRGRPGAFRPSGNALVPPKRPNRKRRTTGNVRPMVGRVEIDLDNCCLLTGLEIRECECDLHREIN